MIIMIVSLLLAALVLMETLTRVAPAERSDRPGDEYWKPSP